MQTFKYYINRKMWFIIIINDFFILGSEGDKKVL